VKRLRTEKLDSRSENGCFVGCPKDSLGYYIYFLADPRVVVARHVIFLKKELIHEGGMAKKIDLIDEGSFVSQIHDRIIKQAELSQENNPHVPRRFDRVP